MSWILENIIEIVGIVLSILIPIITNKFLKTKILNYVILNKVSFNTSKSQFQDLKFRYENEEISDVSTIFLKIANQGQVHIPREDYESDLEISFDNQSRVLAVEVVEKNPAELEIIKKFNEKRINFSPMLLNRNDHFTIKILLADTKNLKIKVNARIKGIRKINMAKNKSTLAYKLYRSFNGISYLVLIILLCKIFGLINIDIRHIIAGSIQLFFTFWFYFYLVEEYKRNNSNH